MLFKFLFSILLFLGIGSQIFGQAADAPLKFLKKNDIKMAKYLIDSLTEMQLYDKDAEVWYANGFIYESIYFSKDSLTRLLTKSALLTAAESYRKAAGGTQNTKYATFANKRLDSAITNNLIKEGEKLERMKRISDAVNHYELYTKIKKEDTLGFIRLAVAADKAKKNDIAEPAYKRLIALKHKTPFIYKSLFFILKESNKHAEALKMKKEALNLFGKDEDWIRMEIALDLDMNKTESAIRKLDSAAKVYPQNSKVYTYNIGAIYDGKEKVDSAIFYYQKSLAIDPDYFEANYNLGGIYSRKAGNLYAKINSMVYLDYLKEGKTLTEEGHAFSRMALPYFEKCYAVKQDEGVKLILKEIYKNLKLDNKLEELDKSP